MNCCKFHKIDCNQGDLCPIRLAQGATPKAAHSKTACSLSSQVCTHAEPLADPAVLRWIRAILLAYAVISLGIFTFWR